MIAHNTAPGDLREALAVEIVEPAGPVLVQARKLTQSLRPDVALEHLKSSQGGEALQLNQSRRQLPFGVCGDGEVDLRKRWKVVHVRRVPLDGDCFFHPLQCSELAQLAKYFFRRLVTQSFEVVW